jgi:hypothetical protein
LGGEGIDCESFFDGNGFVVGHPAHRQYVDFDDKSVLSTTLSVSKRQHAEKIDEMRC